MEKLHEKDGLHCPIWYTRHFLDWHMVFPLGFPGSRGWYTLAGSQEKWAFPNQPVASGKPVLLVSSLLAPRPDPTLWSLVGVLQLSLVDAKFSYCMWKHQGGEASKSQRPWGMLALHPTYPTSPFKGCNPGFLICSLCKSCYSGNLFCPGKKKNKNGISSDYSSW